MNAPHRALATFTNAQFERLVRSGGLGDMRVELRRGLIVKMSPQFVPHGTIKRLLADAIKAAQFPSRTCSKPSARMAQARSTTKS